MNRVLSVAQYEIMMESGVFGGSNRQRVELIRGVIRKMNPIGNEHSLLVSEFDAWCHEHWSRDQFMIRCQLPLLVPTSDGVPEPDIAVVTRKRYTRHPLPEDVLLVVEVADSSVAMDLGEKLALYAEAGIEDHWVVNIPSRVIHVYRSPQRDAYQDVATYRGDDTIAALQHAGAVATPASLFTVLDG